MMYLCLCAVLAFALMPSTVRCQARGQILSGYNITGSPKPFNITCDAHVTNQDSYSFYAFDKRIFIVYSRRPEGIYWKNPERTLWNYTPGLSSEMNFPQGRDWDPCVAEYYEAKRKLYHKSLRIKVRDASCVDVGYYACYPIVQFPDGFALMGYAINSVKFKGC